MTGSKSDAKGGSTKGRQDLSDEFQRAVIEGLAKTPKTLPTRFLYDARGSDLFEDITQLDEYYPTRTEISILENCAGEWAQGLHDGTVLVEFGSGSSIKTEVLLNSTNRIAAYAPVDVSRSALAQASERLRRRFPGLRVIPIEADFSNARLPEELSRMPLAGFFPGSTIGNFEPPAAIGLLKTFARLLGAAGELLIGADLRKERQILEQAYDDSDGVTAEFNLNLLRRMQRELGATVDPGGFEHLALYNDEKGRIEMHLVSLKPQKIVVGGVTFDVELGERIHTENSHKFTVAGFQELAQQAGWMPKRVWTDPENLFSVHALQVAEA